MPEENVTVDEQLDVVEKPSSNICPAAKYSIKIWALCNSETYHTLKVHL